MRTTIFEYSRHEPAGRGVRAAAAAPVAYRAYSRRGAFMILASKRRPSRTARFFLTAVVLLCAMSAAGALTVDYTSLIPATITDPNIGYFDLFGDGSGSTMFILTIDNRGDPATYADLRIRYEVELHYFENGVRTMRTVYEGLSNAFTMYPGEMLVETSNQFLTRDNAAVRVSLHQTLHELDDMTLKNKLYASQRLPDGTLRFRFVLERGGVEIERDEIAHTVVNVQSVNLVAPGAPGADPLAAIFTARPVFVWTSELFPGAYGGQPAFEVRLYRAWSGESQGQALSRPPVFSREVDAFQLAYPDDAPPLVSGAVYYWRVAAVIKGAVQSEIVSPAFRFSFRDWVNQNVLDVLALLGLVVDDGVLRQVDGYDRDVEIIIDGRPVAIAELRDLVYRIVKGDPVILDAQAY